MARFNTNFIMTLAFSALVASGNAIAALCPFCSAINLTFAEQIRSNDIVVIAKLNELPDPVDDPDAELPKAKFEITQILKGKESIKKGMEFRTLLVGRYPVGQEFLVMGVDPPDVAWSTPMKTNPRVTDYLVEIQSLPKSGAERLAFFQQFFEDEESVLAFDAYDEFASASYEDLKDLRPKMDREQLVRWIRDPDTSVNRRRLYFTLLGVCGTPDDIEMLEGFIRSGDRKQQAGLDALVACYLTLKGGDGVSLIEEAFLANKEADYVDTLAAVSALRFHGTDETIVPKEKIVAAIRLLLDRPKMADMIIPDLARWEDWSVTERLVQMFKDADDETNWLRVPVITYLRACPKPEAKQYIEELRKIDPDAVRRADFFLDFDDDDEGWGDEDEDEEDADDSTKTDKAKQGDADKAQSTNPASANDKNKTTTKGEKSEGGGETQAATYQIISTQVSDETTTSGQPHTVKKPIVEGDGETRQMNIGPPVAVTSSGANAAPKVKVESPKIAQASATPTPVAAANSGLKLTWLIIFTPMAVSLVIFILLWSVFNGWFERLIY